LRICLGLAKPRREEHLVLRFFQLQCRGKTTIFAAAIITASQVTFVTADAHASLGLGHPFFQVESNLETGLK
jgi:hypothetical protein